MPSTARPLLAAATAAGLVWWWLRRRADRALEVTSKPGWVSTLIHGDVSPGFEAVRDEFIENFRRRGEVGAAVCIFYRGKKVVDLWGGYRDRRSQAPWERDTLVNVFSTTKGIASLATALQHSRGLLELDAPVSRYWEDFSANGKEKVTVRQLISHMVGLAAIDEPITVEMLEDVVRTYRCIARQRMEWAEPGEHHGYMAQTLGWYESALVHYTDPSRRSIGRFIADEICAPLGCANELYVGLPSTVPDDRLATLEVFSLFQTLLHLDSMPRKFVERLLFHPKSYTARSFLNPKELGNLENYNSRRMRALEMPAANGHATARALASCYSAVERAISRNEMAARGSVAGSSNVLGLRAATLEALQAPAVKATKGGWHDEVRPPLKSREKEGWGGRGARRETTICLCAWAAGAADGHGDVHGLPQAERFFAVRIGRARLWDARGGRQQRVCGPVLRVGIRVRRESDGLLHCGRPARVRAPRAHVRVRRQAARRRGPSRHDQRGTERVDALVPPAGERHREVAREAPGDGASRGVSHQLPATRLLRGPPTNLDLRCRETRKKTGTTRGRGGGHNRAPPARAGFGSAKKKKENRKPNAKKRKKTPNPREGWEDGTPPRHTGISRGEVCGASRRPPSGVYHFLFLSLFAVS